MKKCIKSILIICMNFSVFSYTLQAQGEKKNNPEVLFRSVTSLCAPATAREDLDINNVRAMILNGGDMWWDLVGSGGYQVPKAAPGTTGPSSIFAGGLWIGGVDAGGTIKVAAMTYRQTGNDFWPGPLNSSGTTDASTCLAWDKISKINKQDVKNYISWYKSGSIGTNPVSASVMDVILNWPSIGPEGQPMAPYYDANGNGVYDPLTGDYPDFWLGDNSRPLETLCDAKLKGDQCLFWVFNDNGNAHGETGGPSIGLEVQAQAYAYQTNDEINDMTFYNYTLINKSSFRLDSTYFGVNVDTDIGSASDDFVGCDVELGLGYSYNGDLVDDNPPAGQIPYGANPPAIGLDFFEGPFADPNGIDDAFSSEPPSYQNYGDGIVDNERIGMSKFIYHNNDATVVGYPSDDLGFYLRIKGRWLDNSPITYGGTGHLTGAACDYMFPGISDPLGFGTNGVPQSRWDEESNGNIPADRRFVQTAGPFTLQPGGVNTVTTGLVWARANYGGNLASVTLMKGADAKAQALFNDCFAMLEAPEAPNLVVQELENELILTWSNSSTSNNYNENYSEDYDASSGGDKPYTFQGYIIYQLKDETVTSAELYNIDRARIVFQCDKTDTIKQIVNYKFDLLLQAMVPYEMVNGADLGVVHSCSVKEDRFAIGNTKLINHKTYYYAIVAYGYTPTLKDPNFSIPKNYLPFIASDKFSDGYFSHSAIPHIPSPEAGGTEQYSTFGTGPKLTRVEGHGNGGNVLDLTAESVSEILGASSRTIHPVYEQSRGPVNIKVVDPLNVPKENNFEFKLQGTTSAATWKLKNITTGELVNSDKTIATANEQIINGQISGSTTYSIPKWGISVNVAYTSDPLTTTAIKGGFLEATVTFSDNTKQWLTGLADEEGTTYSNWIRSGATTYPVGQNHFNDAMVSISVGLDQNQEYENILGKTWAPYRLCATGIVTEPIATSIYAKGAPAWPTLISLNKVINLASVDVVITNNKSLWTRCPVLEESDEDALSIGNAKKLMMRDQASVDKSGYDVNDGSLYNAAEGNLISANGMGWFPGYAINLETGERLNMAFGEDSWLAAENGNDMKWNPTGAKYSSTGDPVFGGKHYIYIFGHNGDALYSSTDAFIPNGPRDVPRYDQGKAVYDLLNAAAISSPGVSDGYKREVFTDAMWVNIPLLAAGHTWLESDVKFRLRVAKSYQRGYTTSLATTADTSLAPQNVNWAMYTFNTADIETHKNDNDIAKDALEIINIVPNPYYAYSSYEKKALDNIVKITNLPEKCSITIYTLNGTMIRKFNKSDPKTSLDWDLKNQNAGSIASGMYIIYINVPGVGEKTLKWFAVLRPTDYDSY